MYMEVDLCSELELESELIFHTSNAIPWLFCRPTHPSPASLSPMNSNFSRSPYFQRGIFSVKIGSHFRVCRRRTNNVLNLLQSQNVDKSSQRRAELIYSMPHQTGIVNKTAKHRLIKNFGLHFPIPLSYRSRTTWCTRVAHTFISML